MALSNRMALYNEVAVSGNLNGPSLFVIQGSNVRVLLCVTAVADAPAAHDEILEGQTHNGFWVVLATLSMFIPGSVSAYVENVPRILRIRRVLAAAPDSVTFTLDLIVDPPEPVSI